MARERLTAAATPIDLRSFESRQDLASTLADEIAIALAESIAATGSVFLAVSGGTTPGLLFRELSTRPISWKNVVVTLVDERFVPPRSDRSNEGLLRRTLLEDAAAAASFIGLSRETGTVEEAAALASERLGAERWPLDVVILGMGADGHTASFFPDAPNLDALLDPGNLNVVETVIAPSAPEPRLTLPLARLIAAPLVVLHIEGAEKREVLNAALAERSDLPVASLLRATPVPVTVFWAP